MGSKFMAQHSAQKGFCSMSKKATGLGVPRSKCGGKTVSIPDKRTVIKG